MKKGFTLIEMLIVITIIALLSGLILRGLGGALPKTRDTKRIGDLKNIQSSLELYYAKNNTYPINLDTLATSLNTKLPKDPSTNSSYCYEPLNETLSGVYNSYVLGTQLEGTSNDSINGTCGTFTCGSISTSGGTYYCVGM